MSLPPIASSSPEELPIGAFARLCRLSVKQLRHYDALGLLKPARVDPGSGYRYYLRSQARDAMIIGLMRSVDLPLEAVAEVLDGRWGRLKTHRDDLAAELKRKQLALAAVERIIDVGLPSPEVSLVSEPAHPAEIRRGLAASVAEIGAVTSACVRELLPRYRLVGLFPVDFTEPVPVAVAAIDPAGAEILAGGTFAKVRHVGPYDQIAVTAHGLLSHCAAQGLSPSVLREVYLSDPAVTPLEELVTELWVAIEEEV